MPWWGGRATVGAYVSPAKLLPAWNSALPTCIPGLQLARQLRQVLLQALALVRQRFVRGAQLCRIRLARLGQLLGIVLPRGGELGLLGQLLPLGGHASQLVADHLQARGQGAGKDESSPRPERCRDCTPAVTPKHPVQAQSPPERRSKKSSTREQPDSRQLSCNPPGSPSPAPPGRQSLRGTPPARQHALPPHPPGAAPCRQAGHAAPPPPPLPPGGGSLRRPGAPLWPPGIYKKKNAGRVLGSGSLAACRLTRCRAKLVNQTFAHRSASSARCRSATREPSPAAAASARRSSSACSASRSASRAPTMPRNSVSSAPRAWE